MATLEAIKAKMKKLQAQADALAAKESAKALNTIHALMAQHDLTTADIDAHVDGKQRGKRTGATSKAGSKSETTVAPKYRDPKTGATWSGRGRAPQWIARVKNRDRFLIGGETAGAKQAPVNKAKRNGVYVRGPQPAMYRDPRSGATWSGRGRAPAWLATVKDRKKFLIV
jgi:DNA-binding protein H-NS